MNDIFVVFEVTPDCDNDCIYCYNVWKNHENKTFGTSNRENSFKILENIISKIKPAGICFTGGEPLLCPDLSELIVFAKPGVRFLSIATNGTNLDHEFFSRIDSKKLDLIDISLPTLDEEKYVYICRSGRSEKVKSAFALAKKNGFRVNLSVTAMKMNLEEITDLLRFAFAFSCDSATINFFTPSGNGLFHRNELLLSHEDKLEIIRKADKFSEGTGLPVIFGIPFERCKGDVSSYKHVKFGMCLCGEIKFAVDFCGNVRPCEQSDIVLGNVFKDDFENILKSEKLKNFRSDNLSKHCKDCVHYASCLGGCRFSDERV